MQAYTKDKPNLIKINSKEKESTKNLLYLRFWSDNLVKFTAESPMVDSNCQTDGQNLREKIKKRKKRVF